MKAFCREDKGSGFYHIKEKDTYYSIIYDTNRKKVIISTIITEEAFNEKIEDKKSVEEDEVPQAVINKIRN